MISIIHLDIEGRHLVGTGINAVCLKKGGPEGMGLNSTAKKKEGKTTKVLEREC